ncbi:MAG: hypothetical protein A2391_03350 [Candidatus Brennerbacteria bacterium RIFOXYB1_FULL_41_13]|uniref:AAA+ ATPase domain-containing protein n=1 Tax=Candidatus Brennerbacteria bacterium RIFOXYD1_FULL_41_16 TaxID=1797529 RepID=A0A1G1XM35_9BACT|nr:MAG: hypothetical protein A2391_03350 [Candidatus Brennerbacteria bacterium RIFOXYB1_FULL_41_13]OGY41021.1 MAG: hypothetical protein A2570_00045 [Candidatus Brennerbacteria bacterium RIFOXYD1_FULL_41_16]
MEIIGHTRQLNLLRGFLKNNLFFSSYLFRGSEEIGKKTIALEFAKGLLCENKTFGGCSSLHQIPNERASFCLSCFDSAKRDFLMIDENFLPNQVIESDDEKAYGIDTSRAIIKFLSTAPSVSQRKVVLIDEAHLLTQEAQNSLLKIIEEPPANAVIILITDKPSYLYETILSRTLQIHFSLVSQQTIIHWLEKLVPRSPKSEVEEISRLSLGRPGQAFKFSQDKKLLMQFKKTVLQLLHFESKTIGQRQVLLKDFLETSSDLRVDMAVWQTILRDELLFSFNLADLPLILSKKRSMASGDLVKILKRLLTFSETAENFPATADACFKQVALSIPSC